MLSFEFKVPKSGGTPEELEIYMDAAGLDSLLAQLRFLKEGRTEHVHLVSESWGGNHLDNEAHGVGAAPIRQVKILLR